MTDPRRIGCVFGEMICFPLCSVKWVKWRFKLHIYKYIGVFASFGAPEIMRHGKGGKTG